MAAPVPDDSETRCTNSSKRTKIREAEELHSNLNSQASTNRPENDSHYCEPKNLNDRMFGKLKSIRGKSKVEKVSPGRGSPLGHGTALISARVGDNSHSSQMDGEQTRVVNYKKKVGKQTL